MPVIEECLNTFESFIHSAFCLRAYDSSTAPTLYQARVNASSRLFTLLAFAANCIELLTPLCAVRMRCNLLQKSVASAAALSCRLFEFNVRLLLTLFQLRIACNKTNLTSVSQMSISSTAPRPMLHAPPPPGAQPQTCRRTLSYAVGMWAAIAVIHAARHLLNFIVVIDVIY